MAVTRILLDREVKVQGANFVMVSRRFNYSTSSIDDVRFTY